MGTQGKRVSGLGAKKQHADTYVRKCMPVAANVVLCFIYHSLLFDLSAYSENRIGPSDYMGS